MIKRHPRWLARKWKQEAALFVTRLLQSPQCIYQTEVPATEYPGFLLIRSRDSNSTCFFLPKPDLQCVSHHTRLWQFQDFMLLL